MATFVAFLKANWRFTEAHVILSHLLSDLIDWEGVAPRGSTAPRSGYMYMYACFRFVLRLCCTLRAYCTIYLNSCALFTVGLQGFGGVATP